MTTVRKPLNDFMMRRALRMRAIRIIRKSMGGTGMQANSSKEGEYDKSELEAIPIVAKVASTCQAEDL